MTYLITPAALYINTSIFLPKKSQEILVRRFELPLIMNSYIDLKDAYLRTARYTDILYELYRTFRLILLNHIITMAKYCKNLDDKFTFLRKFGYCSQYKNTGCI